MNIEQYFERIGYGGSAEPTLETLAALQLAHLNTVPFENLSIHNNERIVTDEASLFDKIVTRRRGGFCYENNGLFSRLLRTLGFNVTLLAAGVRKDDGSFGPTFDHLTLQVEFDKPYLVDVGFGDSFTVPLLLAPDTVQAQKFAEFKFIVAGDDWTLASRSQNDTAWRNNYQFTLQSRQYADYLEMCHFHQTSPESIFMQRTVCTVLTATGRKTLANNRYIVTENGEKTERTVDESERAALLEDAFGIVL